MPEGLHTLLPSPLNFSPGSRSMLSILYTRTLRCLGLKLPCFFLPGSRVSNGNSGVSEPSPWRWSLKSGSCPEKCPATQYFWCWSIVLGAYLDVVKEFSTRGVLGGLHGEKFVISVTFRGFCTTRHFSRGSVVTKRRRLKRFPSYTYVHPKLLLYSVLRHRKHLWQAPRGLKGRDYTPPLPLLYLWGEGVSWLQRKVVLRDSCTDYKCRTGYSSSNWWLLRAHWHGPQGQIRFFVFFCLKHPAASIQGINSKPRWWGTLI